MTKTLHGKVHGRIIELDEDLGVADGQEVEVQVTIARSKKRLPGPPPGWKSEGPKSTAGLLADSCCSEEEDRILQHIQDERKRETRRETPQ